jgi:hypothetical protein
MASASRVVGNSRQTQPRTILSTADNATRPGLPPSQHNDLLPQYEDLGFHRRARLEQIDHKRNNQSAEIQHPAEDHPILR